MPAPLVVAHRALGGSGGPYPENTLAGIEGALALGVDAIEIDIRRTRDGHLVLLHDATLRRTAGDPRDLRTLDLAEVEGVRLHPAAPGLEAQPVPTLEAAMRAIDGRAAIVLDFVDEELADDLIALVRRLDAASWTWWTAHRPGLARRLGDATPGSRSLLGWAHNEGYFATPVDAVEACARLGLAGLNADHRYLDRTTISHAHRADLQIGAWTVNEAHRMSALAHLGVDAITTNRPALAQSALSRLT